jgi:hypothetical protein
MTEVNPTRASIQEAIARRESTVRDDRSDFEVVGQVVQSEGVDPVILAGIISTSDFPVHVVSQPFVHRPDVASGPAGDEFTDDSDSRGIPAVGRKYSFHGFGQLSSVVTGNATSHRGTESLFSGV